MRGALAADVIGYEIRGAVWRPPTRAQKGTSMRAAGTDAIGILRWGLRRYIWLFVICVLVGAVLAPLWALQRTPLADARALVIAAQLDVELSAVPRYGEAVFNNGQVAQAIAAKYPDAGDAEDI